MHLRHIVALISCGFAGSAVALDTIDLPIAPPSSIYRVQIGALTDQSEAHNLESKISASGLAPVVINSVTPYYKVLVGQLDNYPDAHELKDDLRASGFPEAFVVTEKNSQGLEARPVSLTGSANKFGLKGLPPIAAATKDSLSGPVAASLPSHDTMMQLDDEAVRAALKPAIDATADTDPAKGYALYYYALTSERTGKDADVKMAADVLVKIGAGKIAAPTDYQRKAALQAADLIHYTQKGYYQAYRMYKTLLASDWLQGQARAQVQAELSGTLLEMMDSGKKGNPDDVRHEMKELYAQMSDEFLEPKARVELMYSETFFWEKEKGGLAIALEYAQLIQNKYSSYPQIFSQAVWNEATALERLGQLEEARDVLLAGFSIKVPEDQAFRNRLKPFNMEKRYSEFLTRLNENLKNSKDSAMWSSHRDSIKQTTPTLQMRVPGIAVLTQEDN